MDENKTDFDRICEIDNQIRKSAEKIERLRCISIGITSHNDSEHVQTSPKNKICDIVTSIIEVEEEIAALNNEKKAICLKIRNSNINDTYKKCLIMRYEYSMNFNRIADNLGKSNRQTHRIRNKAIKEYLKFYDKF